MATVAARGSGTPVTSGTTWTNTTNLYDGAVGSNPATYAVWTSSTSGATAYIESTGHHTAFAAIPAGSTINSVTFNVRHVQNNASRIASGFAQVYDGATTIGAQQALTTTTTSVATNTFTRTPTLAQLQSSTFKIRVSATRAGVTQSATFSVDYVDVTVDYTAPQPSITQAAYRWYDEGTESGATALANQDTAVTGNITNGDATGTLRIRLQSTTAVTVPATDDWQLQYEKNTSGTWVNIAPSSLAVQTYDSPNLTNAAATTNRLTGGTGSFVAGKVSEDSLMDDLGWAGNNFTEFVYALKVIAADVVDGDTLRFRVLRNGATTTMTYSVTPTINVVLIPPVDLVVANAAHIHVSDNVVTVQTAPLQQEGFRWRNDDGSETAATWMAAQDTNTVAGLAQGARLRVTLDAAADATLTPTLYYKKSTDSTFIPVPVGSGGGSPVYIAPSSNVAASGEVTTALLVPPTDKTATNFSVGRMWDDENGTDSLSVVGAPAVPPFNPMIIPWFAAWWAEDPNWAHPANGVGVGQWDDATGNLKHFTQATVEKPTYRSSVAALNNRPALDHDRTWSYMYSQVWTPVSPPWSLVMILHVNVISSGDFIDGKQSDRRAMLGIDGSGKWYLDAGVVVTGGTADTTSSHIMTGIVGLGTTSVLEVDGAATQATGNALLNSGLTLNINYASSGGCIKHEVAFVGFYPGDVHADPGWQTFQQRAATYYALAVAPWTPRNVYGLQGWYDASDASSFTYSSGTLVSQWNDKSGNARHLTQSTVSLQPDRSTTRNGLATVQSDGTDDYLATSAFTMTQPITVVMALFWRPYFLLGPFRSVDGNLSVMDRGGPSVAAKANATDTWVETGVTAGPSVTGQVQVWTFVFSGVTSTAYKNSMPGFTFSPGTTGTTTGVRLGSPSLWGEHAEVCIYNRMLTTTERERVEAYLMNKWGAAFQPPNVLGLQAWYDAADSGTFTYSSGTVVSQWGDKSGNNRHLTQATTLNQPNRNGTRNGLSTVVFDGNNPWMATSAFTMTQPFTIFFANYWNGFAWLPGPIESATQQFFVGAASGPNLKMHAGARLQHSRRVRRCPYVDVHVQRWFVFWLPGRCGPVAVS